MTDSTSRRARVKQAFEDGLAAIKAHDSAVAARDAGTRPLLTKLQDVMNERARHDRVGVHVVLNPQGIDAQQLLATANALVHFSASVQPVDRAAVDVRSRLLACMRLVLEMSEALDAPEHAAAEREQAEAEAEAERERLEAEAKDAPARAQAEIVNRYAAALVAYKRELGLIP